MTCRHCFAVNSDDTHRCGRCGRRIAGFAYAAPEVYPTNGSSALEPAAQLSAVEPVAFDPVVRPIEYQRPLFAGAHQVMELPVAVAPARRETRTRATGTHRAVNPAQQNLVFDESRTVAGYDSVPLIYCDAEVASPVQRLIASLLDGAMILVALGLFLVTFKLCGGELMLNSWTAMFYAGIAAVLALFYKLLFCVCGSDTPGLVWMRLRLLNFDGHIPDRDQRMSRLASSCLSFMVGGLGMVWALVDEENLAWHDHMSKTFLTPIG